MYCLGRLSGKWTLPSLHSHCNACNLFSIGIICPCLCNYKFSNEKSICLGPIINNHYCWIKYCEWWCNSGPVSVGFCPAQTLTPIQATTSIDQHKPQPEFQINQSVRICQTWTSLSTHKGPLYGVDGSRKCIFLWDSSHSTLNSSQHHCKLIFERVHST